MANGNTGVTSFGIGLLFSFFITTNTAGENPTLHRAIEPARISMDITVKDKELTLHFSLSAESLPYIINPNTTVDKLLNRLAALKGIATPERAALCTKTGYQVHQIDQEIQGYQSFICEDAEQLTQINLDLFKALPLLKEADVWLITEQWQNKQINHYTQPSVLIKPGVYL